MKRSHLLFLLALVPACGSTSPTERICQAIADCGELREDQVGACADLLDRGLGGAGERAAEECASCLEVQTCSDIAGGDCYSECEWAAEVLD